MDGKTVLRIFSFFHIIQISLCIFYHERSRILVTPSQPAPKSDFGFSLAYKNDEFSTLVIGAPRYNYIGMMYTCAMKEIPNENKIVCTEVNMDVDSLVNYTREISPNQNFHLGFSVAATRDYFLTCAPLLTMAINPHYGKKVTDVFGTCFGYNDNPYRYQLSLERYLKYKGINSFYLFQGGIGGSTLIDEKNNLTLISKTSLYGDIMYMDLASPQSYSKSMINEMKNKEIKDHLTYLSRLYTNLGYGLAAGNFFSNATMYAFSMTTDRMTGVIAFLEFVPKSKKLALLMGNDKPEFITNEKIGSIFGYAMDATDINLDGYSELLVGAPAFYDDDKYEYGAVHIYIGGSLDLIKDKSKMRTIIGAMKGSRFGSSIATQDIDGDSIPELFIGAPYEDSGLGAVYVLSGYEVNRTLLGYAMFKQVQVTDLKLTQRIQAEGQKKFGFSLQIISDIDDNGCNELTVGSPGTDTVLLYHCLQTINVTVTTELIGTQFVREQDDHFTVAVCADIEYPSILEVAANLTLITTIEGVDADIPVPEFVIPLADMQPSYCENITVLLTNHDPADYKFTATVNLNNSEIENTKRFNSSWVTFSPYSKTEKSIDISRHCKDEDCKSELSMNISWSGDTQYLLGSSEMETVTVRVRNDGRNAYEACMWVTVSGAQVDRIECPNDDVGYKCKLPQPLRMNNEFSLNITLNMSQPTSSDDKLTVAVQLREICHKPDVIKEELVVNYTLDSSQIHIKESSNDLNVTDTEIMNKETPTINNGHEYLIINNGSVLWKDVTVFLNMEKKTFIQSYSASPSGNDRCVKEGNSHDISFMCVLNLMPNSTKKIIGSMEIAKDKISNNLINGKLNTTSSITLYLMSAKEVKFESTTTTIIYQQEYSFSNNKSLIILVATIIAFIILAMIIYILYRANFFKRKQKRKLEVLRESVRRKSLRRNESSADNDSATVSDGIGCIELEVMEDSPFEVDATTVHCDDGVVLIETKPEVNR